MGKSKIFLFKYESPCYNMINEIRPNCLCMFFIGFLNRGCRSVEQGSQAKKAKINF